MTKLLQKWKAVSFCLIVCVGSHANKVISIMIYVVAGLDRSMPGYSIKSLMLLAPDRAFYMSYFTGNFFTVTVPAIVIRYILSELVVHKAFTANNCLV